MLTLAITTKKHHHSQCIDLIFGKLYHHQLTQGSIVQDLAEFYKNLNSKMQSMPQISLPSEPATRKPDFLNLTRLLTASNPPKVLIVWTYWFSGPPAATLSFCLSSPWIPIKQFRLVQCHQEVCLKGLVSHVPPKIS